MEDCLAEYTKIEHLTDCICRRCSFIATLGDLEQQAKGPISPKQRTKAENWSHKVRVALLSGRLEDDIPGVKLRKVFSEVSTKQAMIARVSRLRILKSSEPTLHLGPATTRSRFASQPLDELWAICHEEQQASHFP